DLHREGEIRADVYGGTRNLFNPLTFAVVGIDRRQGGASLRMTVGTRSSSRSQRTSWGVDYQFQNDARRNWANCNGVTSAAASCPAAPNSPESGALTLDQREIVSSLGLYLSNEWGFGSALVSYG